MSTRGAIGFRIGGVDKITYNHHDSYPEELGSNILAELCGRSDWTRVKAKVRKLILVTDDKPPTQEQIDAHAIWANLGVGERKWEDWYCLLREAQGTLKPYMSGNLPIMYDGSQFVLDSLFCEYAYIVNFDNMTLEFYRGFNKNPNGAGRYAATRTTRTRWDGTVYQNEYYGVMLLEAFPLARIPHSRRRDERDKFVNRTLKRWRKLERPFNEADEE